ncbi:MULTISPECIES: hypothetical protein [unclassified Microcoleus]|uniref:hypothetical protein n=1 Tax=unclassified Microcoleus TaxID=2642155 RepID=UPI002FD550FF
MGDGEMGIGNWELRIGNWAILPHSHSPSATLLKGAGFPQAKPSKQATVQRFYAFAY